MLEAVRKFATELAELKQQEQAERDQLRRDIEAQNAALRHDVYGSILLLSDRQSEMYKTQEQRYQETIEYRANDSHWRLNVTKMIEQVGTIVKDNEAARRFGQWRNTGLLVILLAILIWLLLVRVL